MMKIVPGIQPRVVPVAKYQLDGVVANRFYCSYLYVFFAFLQDFLAGAMSAHFCRRRINAQILARQLKCFAVVKADFQQPRLLVQLYFDGTRGPRLKSCHGSGKVGLLQLKLTSIIAASKRTSLARHALVTFAS